jgi:hypothetical protein
MKKRFLSWNGDPPVRNLRTGQKRGVFSIRAHTLGKVTEILFNGVQLGFADEFPAKAASNLFRGAYD